MAKRLQEYVKYTTKELDEYTQTEGSCVRKINTNLHLSMGPFCLDDFKHILMAHIVRSKVGYYDVHLDGIVLDVKKVKILGTTGAIRADDPRIHVNVNADVYLFKPEEGAELKGVVKHIGPHQVGVILYRVFNANLRVLQKVDKNEMQMDQEVKFRIRKYNLQNVFPYIEGELLTPSYENKMARTPQRKSFAIKEENGDSGIEERDGGQELDALLSAIKTEAPSEFGDALEESFKGQTKKKKTKTVVEEPTTDSSFNSTNIKSSKKRKSTASVSTENTDNTETSTTLSVKKIKGELVLSDDALPPTPKKIKKEKVLSDDALPPTPKKIKKEKDAVSTKKKRKSKTILPNLDVKIDEDIKDDPDIIGS